MCLDVFAEDDLIGSVVGRSGYFTAICPDGRTLGMFMTFSEARSALNECARTADA